MNYLGDTGKMIEESGFEDCLIEAGVYRGAVISKIMAGKRTIDEFLKMLIKNYCQMHSTVVHSLIADTSENKENLSTALNELNAALRPVFELIRTFTETCIKRLDTCFLGELPTNG